MCMWFGHNFQIYFCHFFHFNFFLPQIIWKCIDCGYLLSATSHASIENMHVLSMIRLSWGLMTRQPLWVMLCRLPEKGWKKIEDTVQEMKGRDREERGK